MDHYALALASGLGLLTLVACEDDPLSRGAETDAEPNESDRLDGGHLGDDAAVALADSGAGVGRHIVWLRAPSSGGASAAPGGRQLRVRLAPPTSHGASASPEHQLGSVMSGRKQGGNR